MGRQTTCAGCKGPFTQSCPRSYVCHFANSGFPFTQGHAIPCGVRYHKNCVLAGPPFTTRLSGINGLQYQATPLLPWFVCECCQVRALLDREVSRSSRDVALLMLERMRMVDTANHWRTNTTKVYDRLLKTLHQFADWSGIPTLVKPAFDAPSRSPCFGLMYAQLRYSVQGKGRKFQTARQIRSAGAAWYTMAHHQADPEGTRQDGGGNPCETLLYRFFTEGMSRRMGIEVKPSMALSHVQVAYLDKALEVQWRMSRSDRQRLEVAAAGTANLVAWLGWLRASEMFSLRASDVTVTQPEDGERWGLPPGVGAVVLNLLPMTKSSPTSAGDVVMAFTCLSGLSVGKWICRLLKMRPPDGLLFSSAACSHWSSRHFRCTWLYPLLEIMRLQGEPSLGMFRNSTEIQQAFYSMHSYRRGGRSRVQRKARQTENPHPKRRLASDSQVREHGRWRHRHVNEAMHEHYNQWELADRVVITLVSM